MNSVGVQQVQPYIASGRLLMGRAKRKSPEQAAAKLARSIGVPEAQIARGGFRTVPVANYADQDQRHSIRSKQTETVKRSSATICRWIDAGVFDESQKRAIEHCLILWHSAGDCGRLVANLDYIGGGGGGRERDSWRQVEALAQLAEYRRELLSWWTAFENIVRFNVPVSQAAFDRGRNPSERIGWAKGVVGFVAGKVGEWNRF